LLYIPENTDNNEQICIGGRYGQIELYEIEQRQIKTTTDLLQTFPQEHSSFNISSLIHLNENTLISSAWSSSSSSNVIVIWSKSESSYSLYEPIQRITKKEVGGGIRKLVVLKQTNGKDEEEFASCSSDDDNSVIIWSRVKGEDGEFKSKQKIANEGWVETLLYISLTMELIFAPSSSLLQMWSLSSSSSKYVEMQRIKTSGICSFCL